MLFFLLLFPAVWGSQLVHPPIFSPCEFPTPLYSPSAFRTLCGGTNKLPFLCDLHNQILHVSTAGIETAYERYRPYFDRDGNSTLAVILVKQLEAPSNTDQVYTQQRYKCLFENDCTEMNSEIVQGFVNSVKVFMKVYAWKVYERWFAPDEKCTKANVLALIVIDGLVNDARKIPYVRIHTGETKLRAQLSNIQSEANNALVQGWPLQDMLEALVDDLGHAMHELHELNGEPRDHSVPRWARHVFLVCTLLVVFALLIEWYIVRRSKLGLQKSSSGIKIVTAVGGRSKTTHLMFSST